MKKKSFWRGITRKIKRFIRCLVFSGGKGLKMRFLSLKGQILIFSITKVVVKPVDDLSSLIVDNISSSLFKKNNNGRITCSSFIFRKKKVG